MIRPSFSRSGLMFAVAAFALGLATATTNRAFAQAAEKEKETTVSTPLAIITVASADRLLEDVYHMFRTAGKPEMITVIKDLLGNVDDLKGMDRERPFGVMLYLKPGFPPEPSPVGFFPVKNINDLLKTVATGPFTMKPVEGKKKHYELIGPRRTVQVVLKGGYAFVGNDETTLDRTFPDPAKVAGSLAKRYDLAASVNMNSMPKPSRELFATMLRGYSEAELQQRDDEPDEAYQLRKARGQRDLEFVEGLLLDGESLTIGLDASRKNKSVVVEIALKAREKSKFGKLLKNIGGKYSTFSNVLSAKAPLSASVSWNMRKSERRALVQSLRLAESRVSRAVNRLIERDSPQPKKAEEPKEAPKTDAKEKEQPAKKDEPAKKDASPGDDNDKPKTGKHPDVTRIVESLVAAANKGHLDVFLQFMGEPPKSFALVGGAKIEDGRKLGTAMANLLRQVKTLKNERIPEITLNASAYKGVAFHRITPNDAPRQMRRVFGDKPGFYIGTGTKTLWFAVGGDDALAALRKAMDAATDRSNVGRRKDSSAPLQIAVNMADWFALIGNDGNRPRPIRDLAARAFAKGGDDLRIELRTTENGLRLKAKFGEGFVRFIGMSIHRRYERNRGEDQR